MPPSFTRVNLIAGLTDDPAYVGPGFVEIAEGRPRKQSLDVRSSNETSQRSVPDWKAQQAALREGVVDLRNTVDVDKDTMLAARTYLSAMINSSFVHWVQSDMFQPSYMKSSNPMSTRLSNTRSTARSTTIHTIIVCSLSYIPKYSHLATSSQIHTVRGLLKSRRTSCRLAQGRTESGR